MPSTTASRDRAARLRQRIATTRKTHSQATALAQVHNTLGPPESHLSALGVADHFPAAVASQNVNRQLLTAVENLLTHVERELDRHSGLSAP